MLGIPKIQSEWGVTAVRLAMAIIFIVAGWLKFMGGLTTVARSFAAVGVPMPGVTAPFIASLELVGGLLLLFGVLTRWIGIIFAIEFVIATFFVKFRWTGFTDGPVEIMLVAGGVLLALAGPGRVSVDEVWLERPREP